MLSTLPTVLGSSPQVRGALAVLHGHDVAVGIIPAGAGSTPPPARGRDREGDHPRRCGEHRLQSALQSRTVGSSPQVRGAQDEVAETNPNSRIIPAGAGSTRSPPCGPSCGWDHPRRCGEHEAAWNGGDIKKGSSPQVRGAPPEVRAKGAHDGIIPAGAGSTDDADLRKAIERDHPRRCGEHSAVT